MAASAALGCLDPAPKLLEAASDICFSLPALGCFRGACGRLRAQYYGFGPSRSCPKALDAVFG
eukprot:15463987-Alexandrium_andersonii.AAC.1